LINTNDIVFAIDAELLRLLQGGLGPQNPSDPSAQSDWGLVRPDHEFRV
jgi:hypothetical protein